MGIVAELAHGVGDDDASEPKKRNSRRDEGDGGGDAFVFCSTRDHLTQCLCRWSVGREREGPDGVDQMGYSCTDR